MPVIAPQTMTDPLSAFMAGAFTVESRHPVPLVATSFDVRIEAGLVIVATRRIFRNDEPNSI